MNDTQQAQFEGYALVEIMGHQRVAGYVTTLGFGSTVMFKVVQVEEPPIDQALEEDRYIDGRVIYKGSRIRISRERAETLIGAASVYRMTACTEEQARRAQPVKIEVLEMAQRAMVAAPAHSDEEEESQEDLDDDMSQ